MSESKQTPWSHDETERLKRLRAVGETLPDVARLMGRSYDSVATKWAALQVGLSEKRAAGSGYDADTHDLIERLWREGFSASQIAKRVGRTRNAIIGKVHRMGLPGRSAPTRKRPAKRIARAPSPPRLVAAPPPAPKPAALTIIAPVVIAPVSLGDLTREACRFPLEQPDGKPFLYCGAPKVREAYCAAHAALCYQPLKRQAKIKHDDAISLAQRLKAAERAIRGAAR